MRQRDTKAQSMTHKCIKAECRHHAVHLQRGRIKAVKCQEGFSRRLAFVISVAVVLKPSSSSCGLEWSSSIVYEKHMRRCYVFSCRNLVDDFAALLCSGPCPGQSFKTGPGYRAEGQSSSAAGDLYILCDGPQRLLPLPLLS